eukprot:scaffold48121_cov47-Attheya_sp.AAC.12
MKGQAEGRRQLEKYDHDMSHTFIITKSFLLGITKRNTYEAGKTFPYPGFRHTLVKGRCNVPEEPYRQKRNQGLAE